MRFNGITSSNNQHHQHHRREYNKLSPLKTGSKLVVLAENTPKLVVKVGSKNSISNVSHLSSLESNNSTQINERGIK